MSRLLHSRNQRNLTTLPPTLMADPTRFNGPSNGPNQVTYRLLCHASRVGSLIGKAGIVIKSLQQATAARIRIDDAPPDSPDRVIRIISKLNGGEALLRVFEKVLDAAAEADEFDVQDRVVSCRLLSDPAQVGAVIGKGGKVVEKIRAETGCKIRVFNDKLPAGTKPSDEIIEIQGKVSSVKKALVAVAGRIEECLPFDRSKMTASRPYEGFQHGTFDGPRETSTDQHIDHRLQKSSTLPDLSSRHNGNAYGVHSLSAEVNRVSPLDPRALQKEVTFRILCSNDRVGAVIGKGGSTVRALQNEFGANISIAPPVLECEDRLITITALENRESRYPSPAQKAVVLVFSRSVEAGFDRGLDFGSKKESSVTARLVIQSNQVGCLIGKGGAIVSEMRKATGTMIRVIGNNQFPKRTTDNDQVVQISGQFINVQDALYNATGRLRDNLFVSTQNSGGSKSLPSHSLRSLSQSMDHLSLSQNSDHPSSPWLWTPKSADAINSRGSNGVDRGSTPQNGDLEHVSGSKTAIVTHTTVEIMVPNDIIDSVFGENGGNLDRLKQISGAKVTVNGPLLGASSRAIVISGTPDETQAAQSLLQAFILNGS